MIKLKNIRKTTYSYMELEEWLEENKNTEASIDEMFEFFSNKFSVEDIVYLMDAYRMPKKEIKYHLDMYRQSCPKADELIFISTLTKLYKTDRETIIRRIQEIIVIENEEKTLNNGKKNKKRKK